MEVLRIIDSMRQRLCESITKEVRHITISIQHVPDGNTRCLYLPCAAPSPVTKECRAENGVVSWVGSPRSDPDTSALNRPEGRSRVAGGTRAPLGVEDAACTSRTSGRVRAPENIASDAS